MKKTTAIILTLVLVLSFGLMAGCGSKGGNDTPSTSTPASNTENTSAGAGESNTNENSTHEPAKEGEITVNLVLIDKDKKEYKYVLTPKKGSNLKEALYEEGLISEETYYAMFVETIDGHTADVENDGCTWLPKDENGKQIMGTFDAIMLSDGQTITLEYYKVPDMD